MKVTVVLIVLAFLVAAAITLLPILLAPNASPQTSAETGSLTTPTPLVEQMIVTPAGAAPTSASLTAATPTASTPDAALPTQVVPGPKDAAVTAPAASTPAAPGVGTNPASTVPPAPATLNIPRETPVPASGAEMRAAISEEANSGPKVVQAATSGPTVAGVKPQRSSSGGIYTGVSMAGVPWDMNLLTTWERKVAGKSAAIVHYWVFWKSNGAYQPLVPGLLDNIRSHGSIPMITWAPEESGAGINQSEFQLSAIIRGAHDAYIKQFAAEVRAWGKPLFLRWAHEPDGDWFPWAEDANGNQRGEYVLAWRHVHDLFTQAGATNATWVWCPNVEFPNSPRSSYSSLYPGDRYVDWTCIDGYNWGTDFPRNGGWSSFHQIFRYAYDAMVQVAPGKPMMLGEWASSENGGSKATWLLDAFGVQIPNAFQTVRAVVWYNQTAGPVDWRIESSPASSEAYRAVMAEPVYVGAQYGHLLKSPISPP